MRKLYFAEWRLHAGLSQRQLAKVLKVSKTTISRIERGTRGCTLDFLWDFHQVCGTPTMGTVLDHPPPVNTMHRPPKKTDKDLVHLTYENAREVRALLREKRDSKPPRK